MKNLLCNNKIIVHIYPGLQDIHIFFIELGLMSDQVNVSIIN